MRSTIVAAVSMLAVAFPCPAAAQDSDVTPSITMSPSSNQYIYITTRTPTLHIQATFDKSSGATVQCEINSEPNTTCGTRDTSGCPATECWTWMPTLDEGQQGVSACICASNGASYAITGTSFDVDTIPPGTRITEGPPTGMIPTKFRPRFEFVAVEDKDNEHYTAVDSYQCATSSSTSVPSAWSSCQPGDSAGTFPNVFHTYRFWARAVDSAGRVDPTPASMAFSPQPCHVTRLTHPDTWGQLLRRGMRLRVTCVQVRRYSIELGLTKKQYYRLVRHHRGLSPGIWGKIGVLPKLGGSHTFTFGPFKGLPSFLTHLPLQVDMETFGGYPEDPAYGLIQHTGFRIRR